MSSHSRTALRVRPCVESLEDQRLDALEDRSMNGDKVARDGLEELRSEVLDLNHQLRDLWQLYTAQGRMMSRLRQKQLSRRAHRQSSGTSKASPKRKGKT